MQLRVWRNSHFTGRASRPTPPRRVDSARPSPYVRRDPLQPEDIPCAPTLVRDARDATAAPDLGPLPEWDLSDLYAGEDAPELARDLDWLGAECADLRRATTRASSPTLDAAGLLEAIRRYERIQSVSGRIMSFAGLRYYQNTIDPARAKFFGDKQTAITDLSTPLVFFTLELNRIDDARLDALLAADADLARYKPVLDRIRAMKPYQLSDELEKFLHDQSVVGAAAWNRLFDETMAGLEFEVDGETLGLEATLNLLSDTDRARRQAGAEALAVVFAERAPLFARVTNTLAKDKEIEDRWRKLPTPQTSPPPLQRRRARGGPGPARRRGRRLSPPVAPLLRAEGEMARPRQAAGLGPQRAAAPRRRPQDPLGRGPRHRARRLRRLRPAHGRDRRAVLRQGLDRRRRQARQGPRRLRPPDRHRRRTPTCC